MSDTIILSDLPGLLRDMTGERVTYQRLYRMLTNRDLKQGKRTPAGRWYVHRKDVPNIIEELGLTVQEPAL